MVTENQEVVCKINPKCKIDGNCDMTKCPNLQNLVAGDKITQTVGPFVTVNETRQTPHTR